MFGWPSTLSLIDRPQVYGCCSVDQVSSHRDYRELPGYYLSKFARRVKNLRFKFKVLN